jgi:hypothetical protein
MRLLATAALTAAALSITATAFAMPPDFDGERGLEASVSFGGASLFDTSERLFWTPSMTIPNAPNALNGGFALTGAVGYRFQPFLSVGVDAGFIGVGAEQVITRFSSAATYYTFGAYARLYLAEFLFHADTVRQVHFNGLLDVRRLDPWVSIGVEFETITRTETEPTGLNYGTWYRYAIGVPIRVGFDVRLIPALAVGLTAGAGPTFGGWGHVDSTNIVGGNSVTTSATNNAAMVVDGVWFVGLDARYTFTW